MKEKWNIFRDKVGSKIYPLIYFFALVFLDFSFRALYQEAGSTGLFHWAPLAFTISWSLLITTIVVLLPGIIKKIVMSLVITAFGFLYLVHATLYHVAGSFLSFSDLAFAEDGAAFVSIDYLGFSFWVYFFAILSVLIGIFAVILTPKKQKYRVWSSLLSLVLFAGAIVGIIFLHKAFYIKGSENKFTWTDTYDPGSVSALYTEFNNANECLLFCGQYEYLFRSFAKSFDDSTKYEESRNSLDDYYNGRSEEKITNEMTGVLEGQNVIAILLESIDTWMVNEQFMPNLYALQQNGLNFVNHYTPLFLSAGTFNTEAAFNIGFHLPVTGTSAYTYATNIYPYSLPKLFSNKGYEANSYHTLDGKYYNREVVHPLWGYEAFHDQDDLLFTGEPTCDTTLMEAYDKIIGHDGNFFSYIITYSGHGPYTEKRQVIAEKHLEIAEQLAIESGVICENEDTWSQYVRAIAHVRECDAMIGELVARMTEDGSIHNTTLVLFGDHYSKYLTDTDFIMQLKGVDNMYSICNTPFIIYSEKLAPQTIEKVTSSVDMLPTIANLFNLDYNPRYVLGSDAFGEGGGFVAFKDYAWIDSEMLWTPDYEGEETEHIKERSEQVVKFLNASWETVKTNYFQYLEDKKEIPKIEKK